MLYIILKIILNTLSFDYGRIVINFNSKIQQFIIDNFNVIIFVHYDIFEKNNANNALIKI